LQTSPEIIRLAVMLYIRFPLPLRSVEDLLHERGIEISHETVRFWWNRFGPMFAAEIRRRRVDGSERCCGLGGCEVCRNSPPFPPRSTTCSMPSAPSTAETISRPIAPLLSSSGVVSMLK
jgi:hypothetical protein